MESADPKLHLTTEEWDEIENVVNEHLSSR